MKLFKDITIKQKLSQFDIPDFEHKIALVKKWHDDYIHGTLKTDKETSRAPGYNQDFFFNILGYVRKRGANISLVQQDELEEYFETNKKELLKYDSNITQTDRDIDKMVYDLYGLNDDEIKVVENG